MPPESEDLPELTVMVTTSQGREVALAARAPLSVELLEPVTVTRPKQP